MDVSYRPDTGAELLTPEERRQVRRAGLAYFGSVRRRGGHLKSHLLPPEVGRSLSEDQLGREPRPLRFGPYVQLTVQTPKHRSMRS